MRSAQHRDLANLRLRKEKKQLPQSFDASLDVNTTSAPPNTRSKNKEGPNIGKNGRKGTRKKVKEKITLAGIEPSCESAIKEHVREHLKKKKEKEPPSRSTQYLQAVREA